MTHILITQDHDLNEFCKALDPSFAISIDTEFMRQKTYYAIPALVQIAQEQDGQMVSACIDAVSINNWTPLLTALENAKFCLAHSPDQDFEIFDQLFKDWDFTIYDTQIAAALLGEQTQISYAQLIQNTLELSIDKSQSRTDWLQRPLSSAQLQYAISDVIHLPEAWQKLETQLHEKERFDWFMEDCQRLVAKHQKTRATPKAWQSVKGIKRLQNPDFAIAADLAQWREEQARLADLPRRWMIADDAILELAQEPGQLDKLMDRWSILRKQSAKVSDILNNPSDEFLNLDVKAFEPLTNSEKKNYTKLKQFCEVEAQKLGINMAAIANRKTMERIVRGSSEFLDATNWRHKILLEYLEIND